MARKRTSKKDTVREDYRRLQSAVDKALEDREFMLRTLQEPRIGKIVSTFERDIEIMKESLTAAEKSEFGTLQSRIRARRELLKELRESYEQQLSDAKQALREFEEANALFLSGAKAEPNKKTEKKQEVGASTA